MQTATDPPEALLTRHFDAYIAAKDAAAPKAEQKRWEHIVSLAELTTNVDLAGREGALYEVVYRTSPEKVITRSRFMTTMRNVFGFELAPTRGAVDPAKELVENLFDAFDEHKVDAVDWRVVLMMLRVVTRPTVSPANHLRWGFALMGSEGSFDDNCLPPFHATLRDVKSVFFALFRYDKRDSLAGLLDDAFFELAAAQPKILARLKAIATKRLLKKPENDDSEVVTTKFRNVHDEISFSLAMFDKLLTTPTLKKLLQPPTYQIEEEFAHSVYLEVVKEGRRSKKFNDKARAFLKSRQLYPKRWMFRAWKYLSQYAKVQKRRVRCRLWSAALAKEKIALTKWFDVTLLECRVVELQRVARGGLGRSNARWALRVKAIVIRTQAGVRGFLKRVQFHHRHARRFWAATEINRIVRATLARRFALFRLQDKVDKDSRRLNREKDLWHDKQTRKASTMIQRAYRRRQARKRAEEARILAFQKAAAKAEMAAVEVENTRKRRIYEAMVEEYYQNLKQEHLKTVIYDDFSAKEKAKIISKRRADGVADRELRKRKQKEMEVLLEEQRVDQWLAAWDQMKKDRVAKLRAHLSQCHAAPETAEERKIQSKLKSDAKKQLKVVLERNKQVELPAARRMALAEVIDHRCELEERRVDEERRDAAEAHYAADQARLDAKQKTDEGLAERHQEYAAFQLQRQWIFFKARKELRRRCEAIFTKEFDPDSFQYFYLNKITGEPQWDKPFALGEFDLRPKNRWIILHDDTGVPYYYNPSSLDMQWDQPQGTLKCEACDCDFSNVRCNASNRFLCHACYNQFLLAETSSSSETSLVKRRYTWKDVDGGTIEASSLDLDTLPNISAFEEKHRRASSSRSVRSSISVHSSTRSLVVPQPGDDLTVATSDDHSTAAHTLARHGTSTTFGTVVQALDDGTFDDSDDDCPRESLLERAQRLAATYLDDAKDRRVAIGRRRETEVPILEYPPTNPFLEYAEIAATRAERRKSTDLPLLPN